jgi:AcrR family transcriptional regulator
MRGKKIRSEPAGACCKENKRERILECAAHAFAQGDFHKVLTDDIAAAAGVGKGTVFRYFATKEELFTAAMSYCQERMHKEIEHALSGVEDPVALLRTVCEKLVEYFLYNRHLFHMAHHQRALGDHESHREFHRKQGMLRTQIADIIQRGQTAGALRDTDPELAARMLFGMLRGILHGQEADEQAPANLSALVFDLFLHGMDWSANATGTGDTHDAI